jgi:hypothetical protein
MTIDNNFSPVVAQSYWTLAQMVLWLYTGRVKSFFLLFCATATFVFYIALRITATEAVCFFFEDLLPFIISEPYIKWSHRHSHFTNLCVRHVGITDLGN